MAKVLQWGRALGARNSPASAANSREDASFNGAELWELGIAGAAAVRSVVQRLQWGRALGARNSLHGAGEIQAIVRFNGAELWELGIGGAGAVPAPRIVLQWGRALGARNSHPALAARSTPSQASMGPSFGSSE